MKFKKILEFALGAALVVMPMVGGMTLVANADCDNTVETNLGNILCDSYLSWDLENCEKIADATSISITFTPVGVESVYMGDLVIESSKHDYMIVDGWSNYNIENDMICANDNGDGTYTITKDVTGCFDTTEGTDYYNYITLDLCLGDEITVDAITITDAEGNVLYSAPVTFMDETGHGTVLSNDFNSKLISWDLGTGSSLMDFASVSVTFTPCANSGYIDGSIYLNSYNGYRMYEWSTVAGNKEVTAVDNGDGTYTVTYVDADEFSFDFWNEYDGNQVWFELSEGCDSITINSVIARDADGECVYTASDPDADGFTIADGTLISYSGEGGDIVIPDGVTSIRPFVFQDNTSLTSVVIPDTVTKMGQSVFSGCSNLTNVNIPTGLTEINWFEFENCSSLTSLDIPEGVTTIDVGAFNGCTGLTSIYISKTVTMISDSAFWMNPNNLESITVDPANPIYTSGDGCNCIIDKTSNTLILGCNTTVIPYGVETIAYAFGGCSQMTSIDIPNSVKSIYGGAFGGCDGLTCIVIPESVEMLGDGLFAGCPNLTCVYLPESLYYGARAFANCTSVTDIYYAGSQNEWDALADVIDLFYMPTCPCTVHYAKMGIDSLSNVTNGVKVTWFQGENAVSYRVYRKEAGGKYSLLTTINNGTTTSYIDTTAKSGTTYSYAVKAYDGKSYSGYIGKSIKYLAPATVSALTNYSKGIQVKWTKVTGATGYYVYRKAGPAAKWSKVATITDNATVKWSDTHTAPGIKYQYCVKAYSGSYTAAYKGVTTYRVTTPSISAVTNSAAGKATVKWNKNTSATGYQISYTTGSTTKTVTVSGNTNVSKVISGLTKGKTYTVKVRSYRKVGTTYYYSTWSSAKSVKITK